MLKKYSKTVLIYMADLYGIKKWYLWFFSKKRIRKIIMAAMK